MMSTRLGVLAGGTLLVGLAGISVMRSSDAPTAPAASPSNPVPGTRARPAPRSAEAGSGEVGDVRLDLLRGSGAEFAEADRDPFRFQARTTPRPEGPAPPATPRAKVDAAPAPAVPPGPPPIPPIPLKFIGVLEAPGPALVAILSDSRGGVFYGKEGDIIEGRYKVLNIGADFAELSYVDGRGRQTIRLSGQ